MKILIITPSYKPAYYYGGPIYSVAYLAENLNKQHDVLVLSTLANGNKELSIQPNSRQFIDGVPVIFFKRQTKDHTHFSIGLFKYLWKHASNYDVVHIQSWWNFIAIFSALISFVKGTKYIVSPRGMLSPYTYRSSVFKKIIHFFIGNFLLQKAVLHLTSVDEGDKIKKLNSNYRTFVLPNYIDTNYLVSNRIDPTKFSILFLGRIHPKKGLDILFRSLSALDFEFELNIVGEGNKNYTEQLKSLAESLNIQDKTYLLGSKLKDEKYNYYVNADIMILPSKDENFANTILESLLCGTAVILSTQVGLSDFVIKNELGWVYDGEEKELTIAIKNAYLNFAKRSEIRRKAASIVINEFNAEKLTNKYLQNYRSQWK
jgi:glycosyltransferase involved in cell wall biosynthesis